VVPSVRIQYHPRANPLFARGSVLKSPGTPLFLADDGGDHVVPHGGDERLFWDEDNWAPTCKPCHDTKTAREGR
jgi:5-methylcytosine-specific restriction endonuclease McrA